MNASKILFINLNLENVVEALQLGDIIISGTSVEITFFGLIFVAISERSSDFV